MSCLVLQFYIFYDMVAIKEKILLYTFPIKCFQLLFSMSLGGSILGTRHSPTIDIQQIRRLLSGRKSHHFRIYPIRNIISSTYMNTNVSTLSYYDRTSIKALFNIYPTETESQDIRRAVVNQGPEPQYFYYRFYQVNNIMDQLFACA